MNARKILSKIVGLIQMGIGALSVLFAFLVFYNIFEIQTTLGISAQGFGLYVLVFIIFGLLSVMSGVFLFYEH